MNPVVRRLLAEAWQQAQDQRISSSSTDTAEWWKRFNDPVLETLVQDAFWIAMALTIMFGLTFGTLLTMVMVPTFYATLNRIPSPN